MGIDYDGCYCRQHKNKCSSLFLCYRSDKYCSHSHYYWNYVDWETIVSWKRVKRAHVVLVPHRPRSKTDRMLAWLESTLYCTILNGFQWFSWALQIENSNGHRKQSNVFSGNEMTGWMEEEVKFNSDDNYERFGLIFSRAMVLLSQEYLRVDQMQQERQSDRWFYAYRHLLVVVFGVIRCIWGHWNPFHRLWNVSISSKRREREVSSSTQLETWNQMESTNDHLFVTIGLVCNSTIEQTCPTIDQSVYERFHIVGASTSIERIKEWRGEEWFFGSRESCDNHCSITFKCIDGKPPVLLLYLTNKFFLFSSSSSTNSFLFFLMVGESSSGDHDTTCTCTSHRRTRTIDSFGRDSTTDRSLAVSYRVSGTRKYPSCLSAFVGIGFGGVEGRQK